MCEWPDPLSHSLPLPHTSLPDLLLLCTWKLGIRRFLRRAPKISAVLSASITPNTNATWSTTSCCTEVTCLSAVFWGHGWGWYYRDALSRWPWHLFPGPPFLTLSPGRKSQWSPQWQTTVKTPSGCKRVLHVEGGKGDELCHEHFSEASRGFSAPGIFTFSFLCPHNLAEEGVHEKQNGLVRTHL